MSSPRGGGKRSVPPRRIVAWLAAVMGAVTVLCAVAALALSPDGRTLALPARNAVARWDVQTGKEMRTFTAHSDRIESIAFGPEGRRVLTAGRDGTLLLWNVDGTEIREIADGHYVTRETPFNRAQDVGWFRVRGLFAPDGKSVATLGWRGQVFLWDANTGKVLLEFKGHTARQAERLPNHSGGLAR